MATPRGIYLRILTRVIFFTQLLSFAPLVGCESSAERDLKRGQELVASKKFDEALASFDRSISRDPEGAAAVSAAREGAKIAVFNIKNFIKAVFYYKHLVVYSKDATERVQAQKQVAKIYFEQLADYSKAVVEINKLLSMKLDPQDRVQFKTNLARAYYYQNNFFQAESEVNEFLRGPVGEEDRFQMMVLKGNIYLAKKDISSAAQIFKEIMRLYPQRAIKENVALTLAVAYEEMKDFKNAIAILESMKPYHPAPEYIDIRIKRILDRQKNQPGARGFHR